MKNCILMKEITEDLENILKQIFENQNIANLSKFGNLFGELQKKYRNNDMQSLYKECIFCMQCGI